MAEQPSIHGQSDVVLLSDEAATVEVLERAVAGLWDVVAELTRLRGKSGSSSRPPGLPDSRATPVPLGRAAPAEKRSTR